MKKFLSVLVAVSMLGLAGLPATAEAYRPPLAAAYPSSDNRAGYECWNVLFPLDPFSSRCLTWGTSRSNTDRHLCSSVNGRTNGAWCFTTAWATNRSLTSWRLRIKVSESCAACYGYQSRTYFRAPF